MSFKIPQVKSAKLVCPIHGEYNGWIHEVCGKMIESSCDACEADQQRKREAENSARYRAAASKAAFANSDIPPRFKNKSFQDFKPVSENAAKIKGIIGKFIMNFDESLANGTSFLFSGGTGTGKTHLACAVANNVMMKGKTAVYISSLNFLSKMKRSWNPAEETSEDAIIEHYRAYDLLIFDELGKGQISSNEKAMIFRLIDRRSEECKPTIGITKMQPNELVRLIDDDAVRRLKSGGGGVLLFDWPAYE